VKEGEFTLYFGGRPQILLRKFCNFVIILKL
jgi:hypothetical protein